MVTHHAFDFKGNARRVTRRLATDHDVDTDWSPVIALPLTQEPTALLMSETFTQITEHDALVGRLALRRMFGSLAEGETGDGSWTFKRGGFWTQRATVRRAGSEHALATFQNNTWPGGGTLAVSDGARVRGTTSV